MLRKMMVSYEIEVPVSRLKIGMYVSRLDKQWEKTHFLFQGFFIENEEQIRKLQEECVYVYVEKLGEEDVKTTRIRRNRKSGFGFKSWFTNALKKSSQFFFGQPQRKSVDKPLQNRVPRERRKAHSLRDIMSHKVATHSIEPPEKFSTLEHEVSYAKQSHETVKSLMKEFSGQIQAGDTIDLLIAEQAIYDCMASVLRFPDAMQLVTRLKSKHQSSWQRGMNNAVLAISFGRHLNLIEDDLVTLGLCGLLHDIGYLGISKKDFEKAENKREMIRSHAKVGYEILTKSSGRLAGTVADVAYSHHERLDGSGFPRGLMGSQISSYTRMISIIDTYNTLTHPANINKRLTHYDALSQMLEKANTHFDETLLGAFYLSIGTYPVGCCVQMNTGEIAMVVEVNERYKLRPKIVLLTNSKQEKCTNMMVDLSEREVKKGSYPYIISKIISHPEHYGLTL